MRSRLLSGILLLAACNRAEDPRRTPAPSRGSSGTPTSSASTAASVSKRDADAMVARADSARIRGSPGATVWMLVASDFQCPYCKMWHDSTDAGIRREYVDAGKVRLAFVNFPLAMHAHAFVAAEAAMCAGAQGRFWPYHDALFATQNRWEAAANAQPVLDSLAAATGVDVAPFRSCIAAHVMKPLIQADYDRMAAAGVNSTPSFFIGDRRLSGAAPLSVFRSLLDSALSRPGAAPRP